MLRFLARASVWPLAFATFAALAAAGALAGCSYDWSTAARPTGDAGTLDASRSDASTVDGGAVDAATSDANGGNDAPVSTCDALFAKVASTRAAAKKCVSIAGVCTTHLSDECGCVTVVAQPATAQDSDYLSAVAALKGSGCPLGCGSCSTARDGLCIIVGGGPDTACSQ